MKFRPLTHKLLNASLLIIAVYFLALTVAIFITKGPFMHFLADWFSPDGNITNPSSVLRSIYFASLAIGVILLILKGAFDFPASKTNFSQYPWHIKAYYILTFAGIFFCIGFKKNKLLMGEDGLVENLTFLAAFAGCLLFLFHAGRSKPTGKSIIFLGLAALAFFFAMEEVSWGQRLFRWETPEMLMQVNKQQESNLHNLFNDYFAIGYILVCTVLAAVFFFRDPLTRRFQKLPFGRNIAEMFPSVYFYPAGYFYLFLMLYTVTMDKGGETLEFVFALTLLTYSLGSGTVSPPNH